MAANAPVIVIGGGLAGVECAWLLARRASPSLAESLQRTLGGQ